jgi:hypothetical protein
MKNPNSSRLHNLAIALSCALTALSAQAAGFSSGSTGVDGAFSPTASTTITLPASGIFNYTTVNIPAGVTVKFVRNPANPSAPAILLATGDVTIAGTIDVSGGDSLSTGQGTTGDRTAPGIGGPAGFDGGRGGLPESNRNAGAGLGPGGGVGGVSVTDVNVGAGGSYATLGSLNNGSTQAPASVYGSNLLTPLIGGSGGGGGGGAPAVDGYGGSGGGGGGGAILIASSTIVTLTGSILAKGGNSGVIVGVNVSLPAAQTPRNGGGGSGGAIRIVSGNFAGNGALNVNGGGGADFGGRGGLGRTRVEIATTGTLSLGGVPTLAITSVAGVAAPASPSGTGDVSIPVGTPNPATVAFSASGVPVGNTIALTLTPLRGTLSTATSGPLAGSAASSTATASISIPQGISTLTASASYTITVAMGEMLRQYAGDERVARITLTATYGGASTAKLTTLSGKEYQVPAEVLRMASFGG